MVVGVVLMINSGRYSTSGCSHCISLIRAKVGRRWGMRIEPGARAPSSENQLGGVVLVQQFADRPADADEEAGFCSGGFAGVPHEDTVDEDLFDAGRERHGIAVGGMIDDCVGIEQHEIGERALAEEAAVSPVEALGGQ